MFKKKRFYLLVPILMFALVFGISYVSSIPGCCLNPLVNSLYYCAFYGIQDTTCCSVLFNQNHPYGPSSLADCTANYFDSSSTTCSTAHSGDCTLKCCCGGQLGNQSRLVERKKCNDMGATIYETSEDCNINCGGQINPNPSQDCNSPATPSQVILSAVPEKGKKSMVLSWTDNCQIGRAHV